MSALPSRVALAHRVPGLDATCDLCDSILEFAVHAIFDCPRAASIWSVSPFAFFILCRTSNTIADMIMELKEQSLDKVGDFISTIWTCWNIRNNTLFQSGHPSPLRALEKASELVQDYLSSSLTFKKHWTYQTPPGRHLMRGWLR